jgi:hypothetical protein
VRPPRAKRSPGHPPLDDTDPSVDVHVTMPGKQYDDTYGRATAARISVPEQIRLDMQAAKAGRSRRRIKKPEIGTR